MTLPLAFVNHPSRLEAVAVGITRFDPGEPCKYGHISPRYTATAICVQCNDERNVRRRAAAKVARAARLGPKPKSERWTTELHAQRIAEVEKRRSKMSKLPQQAAQCLVAYEQSAAGKRHARYLDSLLPRA